MKVHMQEGQFDYTNNYGALICLTSWCSLLPATIDPHGQAGKDLLNTAGSSLQT